MPAHALYRLGTVALAGALWLAPPPARAQSAYPPPQSDKPYIPPPLYVKFTAPEGMRVTFYRGSYKPQTLIAPFTVGLRAGYIYRVKVSHIPDNPGLTLYPTLEVRGGLRGDPKVRPREYPAPLAFDPADFEAVAQGGLLAKVLVLENPETAVPVASDRSDPIRFRVTVNQDPMSEALCRGTPLMILRAGQRQVPEEELVAEGRPGTVQLPGEKVLALPRVPPYIPWACPSLYDPLHGPGSPYADCCLPDGGDYGLQAGVGTDGELRGFEPADTVAEYDDAAGRRKLAISNRVCLCIPRYLLISGEQLPGQEVVVNKATGYDAVKIPMVEKVVVAPGLRQQNIQLHGVRGQLALAQTGSLLGTVVYGQVERLELVAQVEGLRGVSGHSLMAPPEQIEKPLVLIKWPDKYGALIGDTVTFTLKYSNRGQKTIRNVVVSDNLITRFEYVEGSQQSDRPATFTTQPNDTGSSILRWEINEDLPPGESGIVRFQVKVR